ncbi:MAG: hypothetical protein J7455_08465 [Roseiflexus sp.]|jgi:hypothetical protein|nr:hypothetical protein [Roseiflexus sp.]MBO9364036.1 hypothetical protein [Roseiflexus sp.]MBO9381747.1 hypothetical protein [Roseiflexus sp.]MBO9388565.1 hypothetical protein [Roseiflexus sp.]
MKPFRRPRSRHRYSPPQRAARRWNDTVSPPLSDRLVSIILAWQPLDQLLTGMMRYPRALMGVASVCGIVIAIWSLIRFGDVIRDTEYRDSLSIIQSAYTQLSPVHPLPPVPDDMVRFLAAYNQASVLAAMQGRADVLSPYLTPDGPAWQAVIQEYARRAETGERHQATLVRWGVLASDTTPEGAWVDTQEQWDVIITIGERIVSSRRGILTRNRYVLRQDDDGWRIVDIATTMLIR